MRIIHIVPGSGGTFYCQNCLRDTALVVALRELGHDVVLAPLYLPLFTDSQEALTESPVFYGAINVYLKERFPFYRRLPKWFTSILDSQFFLRMAARKSGTTQAHGLEDMTLSVLLGEEGNQAEALKQLVTWMKEDENRPDIVHISNALLLGLAPTIRRELGVPVFCSLQDEDSWVASMQTEPMRKVLAAMTELCDYVHTFTSVSRYYADKMKSLVNIPEEKIRVTPVGIELDNYAPAPAPADPPTIGYISKMSEQYGLETLVKAFIELKKDERFKRLRLRATGGMTDDVQPFLEKMRNRLGEQQILGDVDFVPNFSLKDRVTFIQTCTLISVPVPGGEAFGTYQIEAMACGIPVVQPEIGAFPEIINDTGGGILYSPNDVATLKKTLEEILLDSERLQALGAAGRAAVENRYSIKHMAERMSGIYEETVGKESI